LTPLLQYPEMVIHPPNLYSGYTGFTIPFAFALGALLARYPGEKWIHLTRKWTMIAWMFQSAGILLGAHWAYAVLGWGGYWGWDPVEMRRSSVADGHGVPALRDDAGKTRHDEGLERVAGVLHVSALHPRDIPDAQRHSQLGSCLRAIQHRHLVRGFLALIITVCFGAYLKNRDYLKSENQLDSIVSRESSFLFNNLILLVSCIAILSGTLFPVFSEWITGNRISVARRSLIR